jgi:hypothetical protein
VTPLNKIALVGTERVTETPSTGTPIDDLVPSIEGLTPERRVLLSAGMLSIFRRAGYVPPTAASLPAPAPAETIPACSQGAARALGDVFIDGRFELLPEAFQLLTRAAQRVPFSLLVDCLDLRDRVQREAARPVLGERGDWLAHQRAEWEWARARVTREPDAAELERLWHEGRSDDRLAGFARLRDIDAARARELLTSSWKQEPSEFRVALLSALALRLSRDDEEFLQAALRDRAGAVRAAAASLLARLPDSTFAARAIARADAFLDITRVDTVTARPPERFNPEWETDGISAKPPRGVGERAHWLMQAVALVDPAHWSERAGMPPSELTRAAWRGEWGIALMIAWSRAALSHDSSEWIVALWDAWLNADLSADPNAAVIRRELLMQLFLRMPADAAHERIGTLLLAPALAADLGARVLDAIDLAAATAAGSTSGGLQLGRLLRPAGPAVPATLFDRALALASLDSVRAIPTAVTLDFDVFAQQIRLRQRLHQEIAR